MNATPHNQLVLQRNGAGMPSSLRALIVSLTGAALALLLVSANARGAVPTGFTEALVAGELTAPTAMTIDSDGRLFIGEQKGRLRIVKNGALLPTPFLTLNVDSTGERGLLGVALDPDFETNQYVYVYYTALSPARHNRVSRFTASGDLAQSGSEVVLLELDNLGTASNHNGGALHFGPDGRLYVAVGDNANGANAQSMSTRLGKILRINRDGSIPDDNPFAASAIGANRSIWALGLRNPFTFAFDSATSAMFINDVGQNTYEEINDGVAGANYGWPGTEGPTSNPLYKTPRYVYAHSGSPLVGCAITGGTFYRPRVMRFPAQYAGTYFFADYCSGWIAALNPGAGNAVSVFATGGSAIVDLLVDDEGALFYLARGDGGAGDGGVYRVTYGDGPPRIVAHPASATVSPGQTATFVVQASGAGPMRYQWERYRGEIAGAVASSHTILPAGVSDHGALYRAVVSNEFGSVTSEEAMLTVSANAAPTAVFTQPAAGVLYTAGSRYTVAATAADAEDGVLPASAFTWRIDFHHDEHIHPFGTASGARSVSFTAQTTGETAANVWYRFHLEVRDSGGRAYATYRDFHPRTARVTLTSAPAGVQLTLDAQPATNSVPVTSVVGVRRVIGAPATQTIGGIAYQFVSWSDGGAATHTISTPTTNRTYTATYSRVTTPPGGCTAAPRAPSALTATVAGTTLTIRWNPPVAGDPLTSYVIQSGTAPGQTVASRTFPTSVTSMSTTLPTGTYYIRAHAFNACGTSAASNEVIASR